MSAFRLVLIFVLLTTAQSAAADEGCSCKQPKSKTAIYGARAFTHSELGRAIGATPSGAKACEEAADRLREFYESRGFVRATVSVASPSSGACALRVVEGKRFLVRRIDFGTPDVIDAADALKAGPLDVGESYKPQSIDRVITRINRSKAVGPLTRDDVEVKIDDEGGTVDITFHLRERR